MAKLIKFDLIIDGNKVKTFEELQDNLHADLLPYLKSGKLAKWFASRELADKAALIAAIDLNQSDLALLSAVCEVLELEADDDILQEILDTADKLAAAIPAVSTNDTDSNIEAETSESTTTGYREDWSGRDLSWRSFKGDDLSHYNFSGADLSRCDFSGANLEGANFEGANLAPAALLGANLEGANFEGANLANAVLNGANLEGANLQGAVITGADFTFADLSKANFKNVMGDETIFASCTCNKTDFSDSSLTKSNFTNTHLINAYFLNSKLNGSKFITEKFDDEEFDDEEFNEVMKIMKINKDRIYKQCSILNTDFSFSNLSGCEFEDVDNMDTAKFTGVLGFSRY